MWGSSRVVKILQVVQRGFTAPFSFGIVDALLMEAVCRI